MNWIKKVFDWLVESEDPHDDYGYDDYHDCHDCDDEGCDD